MSDEEQTELDILQNYCLGLLSEEDKTKVDIMCISYPELANELKLLHLSIEKYKENHKMQHLKELRNAIWEAIQHSKNNSPK